jgi:atypical dual specificity phosphatase
VFSGVATKKPTLFFFSSVSRCHPLVSHLFQNGEIEKRGLIELYLPTPDYTPPKLEDLKKAVAFVEDNAQRGVITYVHCKAGKGRAPSVVVCYLMKKHGFSPRQAQDYIVQRRPQISKNLYTKQSVLDFQAWLSETK